MKLGLFRANLWLAFSLVLTGCGGGGESGDAPEPVTLKSIALESDASSAPAGRSAQYLARATYSDGSKSVVTTTATWTSATPATATVNAAGTVKAVAPGTTTITASISGISGSAAFQTTPAVATSLSSTPTSSSQPAGRSAQLTLTAQYSDGSSKDVTTLATWASSNEAVARVSSGRVQAISAGTAIITASFDSLSSTTSFETTAATIDGLTISPPNPSAPTGATLQLRVDASYSDGSSRDMSATATWASDKASVATVSSSGLVKAVSTGTASITATAAGASATTTFTATSAAVAGLTIKSPASKVAEGYSLQLTAQATYTDGTTADVTMAAWSAACSTASVNTSGLVTGQKPGTCNVAATYEGKSASTSLTITERPVAAWGDSLTAGAGRSSTAMSYPSQLATLTGRQVWNNGVGSQTSPQIAARQGGAPAKFSFAGQTLGTGKTDVASYSTTPLIATNQGSLPGSILGIDGLLSLVDATTNAWKIAFTPTALASPMTVPDNTPWIPATDNQRDAINVLWLGRNNYTEFSQVVSDVSAAVKHVRSGRVIVLSVLNGNYGSTAKGEYKGGTLYKQILDLNQALSAIPGVRYIDVRAMLVAAYDPSSSQDVQDNINDIPPTSLRSDSIHLNDKGYTLITRAVADDISAAGW